MPESRVSIENSILGPIKIIQKPRPGEFNPVRLTLADSILDASSGEHAYDDRLAHSRLTVERSTILGNVRVYAIDLAENSIFQGKVRVAGRQVGCMRFCSLAMAPGSQTPRRYGCQPDLAERALRETDEWKESSNEARDAAEQQERQRVRPRFSSVRYGGDPDYCQLSQSCADEIRRGADDESEMGVFHDLFWPLREANLRARLEEYTPADMEPAIFFET
jgi:hypothetical protein